MLQQSLFGLLPLFSLVFLLLLVSVKNSNIYMNCPQLYFTTTTPYELNVNSLFTSMVDSASVSYFNTFVISSPGSSESDVVYGLFQCQGDLSNYDCRECVWSSVSQLNTSCHTSTSATIQLEGCFVKYNNTSFFGIEDTTKMLKKCGPSTGYSSNKLTQLDAALTYLINANGQYFHGSGYGSVQGVMQCIQDLSVEQCEDCVLEAHGHLRSECETSTWGGMYLGKCYIRYVDHLYQSKVDNGNNDYNNDENGRNRGKRGIEKITPWIYLALTFLGGGGLSTFYFKRVEVRHRITTTSKGVLTSVRVRLRGY